MELHDDSLSAMLLATLGLLASARAFYLPGIAPTDYSEGDEINLLVNRLTSSGGNESNSILGYDFYRPEFHFCRPVDGIQAVGGSLGSIIFGDRIYVSPIRLRILENVSCRFLCKSHYSKADLKFVHARIKEGMYNHWLIDGLPLAHKTTITEPGKNGVPKAVVFYDNGFPLGISNLGSNGDEISLHNHFDFEIEYHTVDNKHRIVGASITNVNRPPADDTANSFSCPTSGFSRMLDLNHEADVSFSYSVSWVYSETPWATRWDKYLHVFEPQVNWFALVNTTVLVFFLFCFCSLTLLRMLRKDIATYNNPDELEDLNDEIGWKLISGDVFRTPKYLMAYALAIGGGAHILVAVLATLLLALVGLLSPANRGSFSTVLIILNALLGGLDGFMSAATYKLWGGQNWKLNLLITPVLIPCLLFIMFLSMNFLLIFSKASGAVPLGTMLVLILIWFLFSFPLSLAGGLVAFRKKWYEPPIRVNRIPRQIPPKRWYFKTLPVMIIGGLIPFLAFALQLHFVLSAIWFQKLYYMFGFLFTSILSMLLLSATVGTLALYFTLCNEDYRWQWQVFCVSGSPACFVFIYAIWYMASRMHLSSFVEKMLYTGYCFMASMLCFLALGMVGAITSFHLVRIIYSSIKLE